MAAAAAALEIFQTNDALVRLLCIFLHVSLHITSLRRPLFSTLSLFRAHFSLNHG
jgi:hypothetical protein